MTQITLASLAEEAARKAAKAPLGSGRANAAAAARDGLMAGMPSRAALEADPVLGSLLRELNASLK